MFYDSLPVQGTPGGDFAFERFINLAMPEYSNWLRARNLDPTPVITDSADLTGSIGMFNSTGEIKYVAKRLMIFHLIHWCNICYLLITGIKGSTTILP